MAIDITTIIGSDPNLVAWIGTSNGFFMFLLIVVAILILKGLALYKAARLQEKTWFWVILIVNTMGILPIIYLYMKRKK